MAAEDRIHGSHGEMLLDPTGGTSLVAVASINKWDMDIAKDHVKVTCFGDRNQVYVDGLPDIKGTYGGFYDPADGLVVFDVILGVVKPRLELRPDSSDAVNIFTGKATMDGKISVDANGAVTIGGAFVAAGDWSLPSATS
jgi:hypothetical protein